MHITLPNSKNRGLETDVFNKIHKPVNFVLDLATWYSALECKHNASVHIAQISVSTAVVLKPKKPGFLL